MDKTISDRLNELRNERFESLPEMPRTTFASPTTGRPVDGFDGRAQHMVPISRKRGVTSFEASSAPLEHLVFTGKLMRHAEDKAIAEARAEAAYMYRDDMQKAEIAGLGAQVISDANGGGGNRATLSEHKLFAMQSLGELKDCMGKKEYQLLERVVWKDEWVFVIPEPVRRAKSAAHRKARKKAIEAMRHKALEEIRMVLDLAAVHYGLTMMGVVRERWARPSRRKPSAAGPVLRRARATTDPARLSPRP